MHAPGEPGETGFRDARVAVARSTLGQWGSLPLNCEEFCLKIITAYAQIGGQERKADTVLEHIASTQTGLPHNFTGNADVSAGLWLGTDVPKPDFFL